MSAVGLMACSGSPSFELTASGSGDQIPLTVTFTPSETDVDELRWDFGDDETLTSSVEDGSVSHTYSTIGSYTVTVVAQNRDNGEPGDSATLNVIATAGMLNHISLSPDSLTVLPEGKATFSISAFDQFGNELADPETTYPASSSAGTIDQQGRSTASLNAGA